MRRSLGVFDVLCIGLNAIVGSGIFMLPDDLARDMGAFSPLAFVLCTLGLLPVALCYAEAARRVDRSGGPYVYAAQQFGPSVGFAVGWMCFANSVFSFAAVAAAAAAYGARVLPSLNGPNAPKLFALFVIALFAALNYRGAKVGSVAINLFTFAKFSVLFVLVSALLPHVSMSSVSFALPRGVGGVGAATFAAVFAVQGFEVVSVPAGETRDPQYAMPRAIVGSLVGASLVYLSVQATLVFAVPTLAAPSDAPLADASLAVVPSLARVVMVGGLISTLGFVSGTALGTPRYLYAMATDGLLPRSMAAVHPRFESPYLAVLVTALLAALLALAFDYRSLVGMSNVSVAVQYLATCLAVWKMRRRADQAAKDRAGSFAAPLLGSMVSLWLFTQASGEELWWTLGSFAVGIALLSRARI